MKIEEIQIKARREFNNAICLIGVIPFLVFLYLLVVKVSSFKILVGDVGYVMISAMILLLLGIFIGRKLLWDLISNLIEFSRQIMNMQQELVEKKRLAAITETALSLGHEINNPLLVIRGNLAMLEIDMSQSSFDNSIKERLVLIKSYFNRIGEVTHKMSRLSNPVLTDVYGDTNMIDLGNSE